jgi:hypothetical protein
MEWLHPTWFYAAQKKDIEKWMTAEFKKCYRDKRYAVPLSYAVDYHSPIVVRRLLKIGADPRQRYPECSRGVVYTILDSAVANTLLCYPHESEQDMEEKVLVAAILQHHVEHPPRLCATAWVIAQLPGDWPEMMEPILKRLAKIKPGK